MIGLWHTAVQHTQRCSTHSCTAHTAVQHTQLYSTHSGAAHSCTAHTAVQHTQLYSTHSGAAHSCTAHISVQHTAVQHTAVQHTHLCSTQRCSTHSWHLQQHSWVQLKSLFKRMSSMLTMLSRITVVRPTEMWRIFWSGYWANRIMTPR